MDELVHIQEWILANSRIFHLVKKHQEIKLWPSNVFILHV